MSSILNLLVNLLIGIGSIFIALAVYKLSRQKLRELWLENFGEIHTTFWNDNDIREIRYCITYDEAYEPLKAVLLHRRSIYENVDENQKRLEKDEYVLLDKLDKFLNLLERAINIRPELDKYNDLWRALFFQFWLQKCFDNKDRTELTWYIQTFYENLEKVSNEFK